MRCPTLSELPSPPPGKSGWPWTAESAQLPDTMPDGAPWPRVSIVTPSYNQAQFIEETIRSVLLQGYPDLEYIIIDGGSTDGSVEIIRKYEPWLAYWVSEKDRGQSEAINKGFARATGEIVAWLNSDDYYEPSVFHRVIACLVAHPEYSVIYSDCYLVNEHSQRLRLNYCRDFSKIGLLESNFISQPTVFLRAGVIGIVGELDQSLHYCMDLDWWLRMVQQGLIFYRFSGVFANYRLAVNTKTLSRPFSFWEEIIPLVEHFMVGDHVLDEMSKQAIRRRLYYLAGIACAYDDRECRTTAKYYLQEAFGNDYLSYGDISRLAEELVSYSKGKAGTDSFIQQDAFLRCFFSLMPQGHLLNALWGHVAMIQAFAAGYQQDWPRVRQYVPQAFRYSATARRNVGLWKMAWRAFTLRPEKGGASDA